MRTRVVAPRSRRGSALVEFALALPLLVAILGGTFQFGYSFYIYNRLHMGVRGAARYASLCDYNGSGGAPTAAYLNAIKNFAVSGNPAASTPPMVPGLTPANVNVQVTMVSGNPDVITVSLTGYQINAIFQAYTLTGKPAATFRFSGRIASL